MTTNDWLVVAHNWTALNLTANQERIPVFDSDNLMVKTSPSPSPGILCRHYLLDLKLESITDRVRAGYGVDVEGMLYVLYVLENGKPIPVYVGIARAKGHSGCLSSLFKSPRKKPRFDDYDGYHIGDLSTQVIPGYSKRKAYKKAWADRLFSHWPSVNPKLHQPVYFWGNPWSKSNVSAIKSLGHTSLCLEEQVLIHAFNTTYPGRLLNC